MPGNCCIQSVTVINTQGKQELLRLIISTDASSLQVLKHSFESVYDIHNPPVVQSCIQQNPFKTVCNSRYGLLRTENIPTKYNTHACMEMVVQ
jgi:hypothetical protein